MPLPRDIAVGLGSSVAGGLVANQLPQTAGHWKAKRKARLVRATTDVRKGGSSQGKEEPFLPAYTLERRPLKGKARRRIMTRRAVRSGATSAAIGGGAVLGLSREVSPKSLKAAGASAALSGAAGGLLAAATTPKSEWHMRRMHGVKARPTAPGQKPKIYVQGTDSVTKAFDSGTDPMGFIQNKANQTGQKARVLRVSTLKPKKLQALGQRAQMQDLSSVAKGKDKAHATEVGAGAALGLAAANAGRVEAGLDRTIEQTRGRLLARAGVNRDGSSASLKRRDSVGRPLRNEGAKARAQKAQTINRESNRLKRLVRVPDMTTVKGMKVPVKPPLLAAGMVGGAGLAWHGSRNLVNKAITRNDVDNAFAGAAGGAGGYQLGMYATKPIGRAYQKKRNAMSEAMGPSDPNSPNRIMAQHAKTVGLPKDAKLGDPRWKTYFRTMPKQLPGARFDRAMSRLHGGKTGVALTVGTGALAAGGAVAQGRKKSGIHKALVYNGPGQAPSAIIVKRGPYSPPEGHREDVTADLTSNAKTNQAYVQRARAWKRQERSGRVPHKTAGPLVRARRVWRNKTFTPLEQKRFAREQGERDIKIRRDVAAQYRDDSTLSPAARALKEFDSGKRTTPDHLRVQKGLQYQGPGRPPVERLRVA